MNRHIKYLTETFKALESLFLIVFVWLLIIVALCLSVTTLIDYSFYTNNKFHFQQSDNLTHLANTLAGTVGLLLTLAGIIALLKTIQQTKKEMVETQNIMNQQLVQSTFFNVLKNHSETIGGHNFDENDWLPNKKKQLNQYATDLENKLFTSFAYTFASPQQIYLTDPKYKNIAKSIIHIAEMIETKITDKEFYHKTFYYNLTVNEKFLFGMVITNQLEKVLPLSFNYSEYYLANTLFKNSTVNGYFPSLYYLCKGEQIYTDVESVQTQLIKESAKDQLQYLISSNDNKDLILEGYHFTYDTIPTTNRQRGEIKTSMLEGDFSDIFMKHILPILVNTNSAKMEIYFHFKCRGVNYTVIKGFGFQRTFANKAQLAHNTRDKEIFDWCTRFGSEKIHIIYCNIV